MIHDDDWWSISGDTRLIQCAWILRSLENSHLLSMKIEFELKLLWARFELTTPCLSIAVNQLLGPLDTRLQKKTTWVYISTMYVCYRQLVIYTKHRVKFVKLYIYMYIRHIYRKYLKSQMSYILTIFSWLVTFSKFPDNVTSLRLPDKG